MPSVNLVSSVRREGRHLVGVVLGERSNGARDARMRQLIEDHIRQAATIRTAPAIIAVPEPAAGAPSKAAMPLLPAGNELPPNAIPAMQGPRPVSLEYVP